ncbi:MAG: adenosylmethionine--8-amino-7-oxononanoate transaminase [Bacteroidia bacterium]
MKGILWRPFTQMGLDPPLGHIVRAQGMYLYDDTGRSWWDGVGSWWVGVHGHAHPIIAKAIYQQAATLEQVLFADWTHPAAQKLADLLAEMTGLPYVFFSDDGSTAIEVAFKIARQYFFNQGEKRSLFVALQGGYHGDTLGAMSISHRTAFTSPFGEYLFHVETLPFPDSPENLSRALEKLETILKKEPIAAFIAEPLLQGTAGMRTYPPQAWDAIAALVRRQGGLIIADEILTGMGRTGSFLATDFCKEKPDILTLSKGITGGFLPLGLTLTSSKVYLAFESAQWEKALFHGHSYTANPLACAAAVANLTLWTKAQDTYQTLCQIQKTIAAELQTLFPTRHIGLIWAVELPSPTPGYFASIGKAFKKWAWENGFYLRPLGNVVYTLPMLAAQPHELWEVVSLLSTFRQKYLNL